MQYSGVLFHHQARGRRGHVWERRDRAYLVEADTSALAAFRYLDRNAARAGLVQDPATYPWSSCAAYALGTPNPLITLHPSYLALSPYANGRQRQYRLFRRFRSCHAGAAEREQHHLEEQEWTSHDGQAHRDWLT